MAGRRRGTQFGLFLLGSELMAFGVNRVPPVTLGTIALNVLAYLYLPMRIGETCMSTQNVWYQWDLKRLLIGAIDHADDFHLYYNMVSLLWKGTSLEKRVKSPYFAYILVVFTVLTSVTLVGLNALLAHLTHDQYYMHQCAVGFSGVLFALKVLTTHYEPPGTRYLLNFIPVPSKWVYWAELALIQVLVPNASFTGHLAGILVGLAYTKGPLKYMMEMFIPTAPSYQYRSERSGNTENRSYPRRYGSSYGAQRSGYSHDAPYPPPSAPPGQFGSESRYRGTGAPDPPGWRAPGQRLYPDLGAESEAYSGETTHMTEEEQMRYILERSRWER